MRSIQFHRWKLFPGQMAVEEKWALWGRGFRFCGLGDGGCFYGNLRLEISDFKGRDASRTARTAHQAGLADDARPFSNFKIIPKANVFAFSFRFWLGLSFANPSFKSISRSDFDFLRATPFPLGFFAEIWQKSASYTYHTNSTFQGL